MENLHKSGARGTTLKCSPKEWRPKKTAIVESKDPSTLSPDEHIGSLIAYEVEIEHPDDKESKEKIIALKAFTSSYAEDEADDAILFR